MQLDDKKWGTIAKLNKMKCLLAEVLQTYKVTDSKVNDQKLNVYILTEISVFGAYFPIFNVLVAITDIVLKNKKKIASAWENSIPHD